MKDTPQTSKSNTAISERELAARRGPRAEAALLVEIANNQEAMSALPQDTQKELLAFKKKHEEEVVRQEAERKRQEEELERQRQWQLRRERSKREEVLCKGHWGENVPLERRFALCERDGKRFVGGVGQELDPSTWEPEKQYCAIDLVRGYMAPYWNYFGYGLPGEEFVKQRIKPILETNNEAKLVNFLRGEYDFFRCREEDKDKKFCICTYSFSPYFTITGRGEYKTLAEHQADLKREFCKKEKEEE